MAHPWTALGVDPDTDGGIAYLFGSSDDAGSSSALTEADPAAKASASRSSGAATAERVCSSSPQLLPERTDGLSEDAPRAIGQRVERNGQWPHGRGVARLRTIRTVRNIFGDRRGGSRGATNGAAWRDCLECYYREKGELLYPFTTIAQANSLILR